ncbi:hypothetical protein XENOCAPTIV_025392 [Xenoophorus captivus]|uniref:Uncharacterized protein n=1 Tax=Xenoophorus captivus TaxID=1517983 RepID=A0ABV0QTG3_9TELE
MIYSPRSVFAYFPSVCSFLCVQFNSLCVNYSSSLCLPGLLSSTAVPHHPDYAHLDPMSLPTLASVYKLPGFNWALLVLSVVLPMLLPWSPHAHCVGFLLSLLSLLPCLSTALVCILVLFSTHKT